MEMDVIVISIIRIMKQFGKNKPWSDSYADQGCKTWNSEEAMVAVVGFGPRRMREDWPYGKISEETRPSRGCSLSNPGNRPRQWIAGRSNAPIVSNGRQIIKLYNMFIFSLLQ